MKCFNHLSEEAVGVCKHCCKAVCRQCLISNEEDILACSTHCQQEIMVYQKMMDRAKMAYGLSPGRIPATIIFLLLFGLFFIVIGALVIVSGHANGVISLAFGGLFLLAAVLNWYNQKKSGIKI
jgi:hypothetical protein